MRIEMRSGNFWVVLFFSWGCFLKLENKLFIYYYLWELQCSCHKYCYCGFAFIQYLKISDIITNWLSFYGLVHDRHVTSVFSQIKVRVLKVVFVFIITDLVNLQYQTLHMCMCRSVSTIAPLFVLQRKMYVHAFFILNISIGTRSSSQKCFEPWGIWTRISNGSPSRKHWWAGRGGYTIYCASLWRLSAKWMV